MYAMCLSIDAGLDEYFSPNYGLNKAALQVAFGAVPLDAAGRAGETGACVTRQGLVDRRVKSLSSVVATGRDRSSVIGE